MTTKSDSKISNFTQMLRALILGQTVMGVAEPVGIFLQNNISDLIKGVRGNSNSLKASIHLSRGEVMREKGQTAEVGVSEFDVPLVRLKKRVPVQVVLSVAVIVVEVADLNRARQFGLIG
jgi:hypothetical protein